MRFTICIAMGALAFAAVLHAQQAEQRRASAPPPAAPAPRPRIGYAADPAPPQAPVQTQVAPPGYYYNQGYYNNQSYYNTQGGYFISGAPYLVLTDGSVVVNFGNGYERVIRPCGSTRSNAPTDPYARDALGRIPEPPGIAALRPGARGQVSGNAPRRNSAACYRSDGRGGMQIVAGGY